MKLEQLKPHLIYTFKSESELVKTIEILSQNFTESREKIQDYLKSEKYVSAYTCFYLATNFNKWQGVLDKLDISAKNFDEMEIIDIGSGPGTFALAILEQNPKQNISLIESSKFMRVQADKLLKAFYPNRSIKIVSSTKSIEKKTKTRLGIFGHSANEMEEATIKEIIGELELDQVLFIEPGTKDFYKKFKELRVYFKNLKYDILYPCPTQGTCPLSEEDWCHQFLYLDHSEDVQRLSQMAKKNRRLLPISIYYLALNQKNTFDNHRVIRVFKPTKFSYDYQLCQKNGEENRTILIEQQKRKLSKKEMKKMEAIFAGDDIVFELVKELSEQKLRVDIKL